MMWGYAQGLRKTEEFRINPRFQIGVMGKTVSSIKYKWKAVRIDCLGISRPSNMTMLRVRSLQQSHWETLRCGYG